LIEIIKKPDPKTCTLIIRLLVEGNSIRATTRIADVSKNTVAKLLEDSGKARATYHNANVKPVQAKHVQADEIWSFFYAKAKTVEGAKACAPHLQAAALAQCSEIGD
jgi:lambda repressor-like predicted transcriptional regulator